jgi:hypothetical protein
MVEMTQTASNQGQMAGLMVDLIRQRRLFMYPSKELRLAVIKTVIIESSRGVRLGKSKTADRVDPIIAMAMAALLVTREEGAGSYFEVCDFFTGEPLPSSLTDYDRETGLPKRDILNALRPPDGFRPLARLESESVDGRPKHPGSIWDDLGLSRRKTSRSRGSRSGSRVRGSRSMNTGKRWTRGVPRMQRHLYFGVKSFSGLGE